MYKTVVPETEKNEGSNMNFLGLIISVAAFLIIGIFHPIVIKCEYYWTDKVWPLFLIAGLLCVGASLMVESTIGSSLLGVLGCSFLWSIGELKEQTERVKKGWFPENPKRKS